MWLAVRIKEKGSTRRSPCCCRAARCRRPGSPWTRTRPCCAARGSRSATGSSRSPSGASPRRNSRRGPALPGPPGAGTDPPICASAAHASLQSTPSASSGSSRTAPFPAISLAAGCSFHAGSSTSHQNRGRHHRRGPRGGRRARLLVEGLHARLGLRLGGLGARLEGVGVVATFKTPEIGTISRSS